MKKAHFRTILTATCSLALALGMFGLGGCMRTDNREAATVEPTAQATAQPLTGNAGAVGANPEASASPEANASATSSRPAYDWVASNKGAVDELNRITEIGSSSIVVDGDDAIVGITFDGSYKGGMNDRITGMVKQKLKTLDPALEDIEVTAEPEQVKRIQAMSEKLAGGATIDQLETEFETLYDEIKAARRSGG